MKLSLEQLDRFATDGYLLLSAQFNETEISLLRSSAQIAAKQESPSRVMENDNRAVRSLYGLHASNQVFQQLALHPRLVEPASQIIGGSIYIYQFKINIKAGFYGDRWEWHQDFIFWCKEDGMRMPVPVTAAVFLDDVNDVNGPMLLIPGSHKAGMIETDQHTSNSETQAKFHHYDEGKPAWITNLTAKLKYSLERDVVTRLVDTHGIVAAKAPRGSVLFFDSNLVHASGLNMAPYDRMLALITYNSTANVPAQAHQKRPEFLVCTDTIPIAPIEDDALVLHATASSLQ